MNRYRVLWAILSIVLLASASSAQNVPRADLTLSYSHFQIIHGFTIPTDGSSASVGFNFNNWFGIAGDLGLYHGRIGPAGLLTSTYTFGPRLTLRRSSLFVPFAELLVGGAHFSIPIGGLPASSQGFHAAYALGAGADILLGSRGLFALRPRMDFFETPVPGHALGNVRVSMGFVFHFGKGK